MTTSNVRAPLKVYWQPGCSSCLKTKEFLIANGVKFESINVLEDKKGFQELEALGVRLVPIVARGKQYVYDGLQSGALKPIIDCTFPLDAQGQPRSWNSASINDD